MDLSKIKILLFDVFGTVVDWKGSIEREVESLKLTIDATRFAEEWACGYSRGVQEIKNGAPWRDVSTILQDKGYDLLKQESGSTLLSGTEIINFIQAWRRLAPWPDTIPGIELLREHFMVGMLSNGDVDLLLDISINSNLMWNYYLSGSDCKAFKPDPKVYEYALAEMNLKPDEVMMVASHAFDLRAAQKAGMATAYIDRPGEDTTGKGSDCFDFRVKGIDELAQQIAFRWAGRRLWEALHERAWVTSIGQKSPDTGFSIFTRCPVEDVPIDVPATWEGYPVELKFFGEYAPLGGQV